MPEVESTSQMSSPWMRTSGSAASAAVTAWWNSGTPSGPGVSPRTVASGRTPAAVSTGPRVPQRSASTTATRAPVRRSTWSVMSSAIIGLTGTATSPAFATANFVR